MTSKPSHLFLTVYCLIGFALPDCGLCAQDATVAGDAVTIKSTPTRTVVDNVLVSDQLPAIRVQVHPAIRFQGSFAFRIGDMATGERYVFAETNGGAVSRLVIAQFESLLPESNESYRYSFDQDSEEAGYLWRQNPFAFSNREAATENPTGEAALTVKFLAEKGLTVDDELMMVRRLTVPDQERRHELILSYVEPIAPTKHSLSEFYQGDSETALWNEIAAALEKRSHLAFAIYPLQFAAEKSLFDRFGSATEPQPFAPELDLRGNTYKGCLSADYSTFYFFRNVKPDHEDYRIFQTKFADGRWTSPQELSFCGDNSDLYPLVSTIEPNRLFFISYRRTPGDRSEKPNANFWTTTLVNAEWGTPEHLASANLIKNYNSQPCMVKNGTIYFTSDMPDWSKTETWKMEFANGSYLPPKPFDAVNLFRATNPNRVIFEVCVSPDESYMVLTISENRDPARLYFSRMEDGQWTDPRYLGDIAGCDMQGNFPYITANGHFLLFTRMDKGQYFILPTKRFTGRQ